MFLPYVCKAVYAWCSLPRACGCAYGPAASLSHPPPPRPPSQTVIVVARRLLVLAAGLVRVEQVALGVVVVKVLCEVGAAVAVRPEVPLLLLLLRVVLQRVLRRREGGGALHAGERARREGLCGEICSEICSEVCRERTARVCVSRLACGAPG